MDKIDLKKLWSETHAKTQQTIHDDVNIRKTLKMNHSKIISKVLSDLKLKIFGYSLMLIILTSLMVYALVYLNLKLSANTLILFSFIGLFFIIKIISIINRWLIMTKTINNLSVKESILFFRKKLNRIKIIDFLSYLIYFYTLAICLIYNYINDIGGVKNLSWDNEIQTLVLIAVIILLSIPWLIKYQHNQSYKKLYSNLNDSVNFLNDAT
jgi:hypothetical protein